MGALDDPVTRELLLADATRLDRAPRPVLVDEWQREPAVWDLVRRAVFPEQGLVVRRPATLRAWLAAYAGATATTTSYNAILDAATPGDSNKPAKTTTIAYRDVLSRLWLLDPVSGWSTSRSVFTNLASAPKHQLADPALAARLLGVDVNALLSGSSEPAGVRKPGPLLGALFESLVALSLQAYAQAAEATVHHLRTRDGRREVDFIVQRADQRIVAGADAYRRRDGIAVIPAALLGP